VLVKAAARYVRTQNHEMKRLVPMVVHEIPDNNPRPREADGNATAQLTCFAQNIW
jgi:DNA repair protein RadC